MNQAASNSGEERGNSPDGPGPAAGNDDAGDSVKFDRLRDLLARVLARGAELADQQSTSNLAAGYKEIELAMPRLPYKRWRKLYVALGFWTCWIAEADEGFPENALVSRDDWPRLARILAEDLQNGRDVSDPQIRAIADLSGSFRSNRNE